MLSIRKRFLFIHVPKTGGNSLQLALQEYADERFVVRHADERGIQRFELNRDGVQTTKHSSVAEYIDAYGPELVGGMFKFCCVRSPWERCMSHFFSSHRGLTAWDREAFARFVRTSVRPLRSYIEETPGAGSLRSAVDGMNQVIRFEHFQRDFDGVCDKLGLSRRTLPWANSSGRAGSQKYYDPDLVSLIGSLFAEEIELFEYGAPPGSAASGGQSS